LMGPEAVFEIARLTVVAFAMRSSPSNRPDFVLQNA
jgi:hypothetical protein